MKKFFILFCACTFFVLFFRITPISNDIEHRLREKKSPTIIKIFSPVDFLKNEVLSSGLLEKDFLILKEIIQCESGWQQKWSSGEVKVSKGNVGLAQINHTVHRAELSELGLDPYNAFDNLRYAVVLYEREGIKPWDTWSGHCFRKNLKAIGIEL